WARAMVVVGVRGGGCGGGGLAAVDGDGLRSHRPGATFDPAHRHGRGGHLVQKGGGLPEDEDSWLGWGHLVTEVAGMPGPKPPQIELAERERSELENLVRAQKTGQAQFNHIAEQHTEIRENLAVRRRLVPNALLSERIDL